MVEGLQLQDVTVSIRDDVILDQISFTVRPGTVTALIGHNGSGKSTIMKTILGWQEKKEGKVSLHHIDQDDAFLTFKRDLSYIPEEPFLLSELTIMQHFQLYGQSYQVEEFQLSERINEFIKHMEIDDKLDQYPESLSKGMRQKVQAICALLPDVSLMLIDEPFMGLDVYASDYLQEKIVEKAKMGTTILLTSHQLDRIKDFADNYIMLQQGKIVDQGPISSLPELKRRFE
nr:ABC transporter ATP-binding protein [Aquibacillus saliphilus]